MTSDQGSKHDPFKTQNKVRFAFEDDFLFLNPLKAKKAHFRVRKAGIIGTVFIHQSQAKCS